MAYAKVHADKFYDIVPAGDDGYWLGDDDLGWKGVKFPDLKLYQLDADTLSLENTAGTSYKDFSLGDLNAYRYSADTASVLASFYKARGTKDSPAIVQSGDALGVLNFWGWDGVSWARGAAIQVSVNGIPGLDDMPGRIEFWTSPDGSDTVVEALRVFTDGTKATIMPAAGDYLRIGDAIVSASGLANEDDLLITGNAELGGNLSFGAGKSIKVGVIGIIDLYTTYINVLKNLYIQNGANIRFYGGGGLYDAKLVNDLAGNGQALLNANHLELDEITTPTAVPDHGKVYTKSDNKLYFQDGAGLEHEVAFI